MRSVALSLVSMVALASSASAADIYSQPVGGGLKDVPVVVPINTWAGFYIGVNGGGAWSENNKRIDLFDVNNGKLIPSYIPGTYTPLLLHESDRSGPFGGAQAGYNWQWGNFVAGIEGDIQAAGISDSETTITRLGAPFGGANGNLRIGSSLDWFGTIRGRLGYSFGSVLIYGTGGFAAGGVRDSVFFTENTSPPLRAFNLRDGQTATGFTVGGGLEYAFSPAWSVKLEYQFISLEHERLTNFAAFAGSTFVAPPLIQTIRTSDFDHDFNTVRLGLNYHFHDYVPLPYK